MKRKRSSTNVIGSSPAPENSLGDQTLPEIDPFIEYGRATQEEEDADASDFEESIDKPQEILLTYQTILNINENKFVFGTLPENPIQPLLLASRPSSYVSKIAPESSKPSRTRNLHAKQKKDSLKNLKNPESLSQTKRKKQQKLTFPAVPKLPPVIPEEPEKPGEPAQAQGVREQQDESYEELMVDSLVSIATGLDGSLDEDSPERLTIREVYDSIPAGLKVKQNILAPKVLIDLIMLKLYAQALLKEGPYRKGKIMASEQVAETFHKTSNGAWLARRIRSMFLHYQVHKSLPVETRGGKRIGRSDDAFLLHVEYGSLIKRKALLHHLHLLEGSMRNYSQGWEARRRNLSVSK